MRFQRVKCNHYADCKETDQCFLLYTLEGTIHDNVEKIEHLGITITNNLKWNTRQQY